jgi:endonuclease/exonuclease/phosphatase family metal-dependent hydrolase
MPGLRLLAYNVHGFRAGVGRVANAVSQLRPDVVLLNEARGRGRLRRFARAMEMELAGHGLGWFGGVMNAVLLRPPLRSVGTETVRFSRTGRLPPRGAVVTHLRRAGFHVTAVAVHLGLSDAERMQHARELTDVVAGMAPPILVGGDLNEGPDGKARAWIADRLWDAHTAASPGVSIAGTGETFPAREPRARIDYVFVSEGVEVERCWVGTSSEAELASDHLPLFADVVVGEG